MGLVVGYADPYMEGMAQGLGWEPEVTRGQTRGLSQGVGSEAAKNWLPSQGSQFPAVGLALGPASHPSRPSLLPCCCSGLGYVLGSAMAELTGDWRWALRVSFTSLLSLYTPPPASPPGRMGLSSLLWP